MCLLAFTRNEFTLREEVTQEYITRDNGKTLTLTVGTASITMIQKKLQPEGMAHGVQFRPVHGHRAGSKCTEWTKWNWGYY